MGISELLFLKHTSLIVMSSLYPEFLRVAQQSNVINASPFSPTKIAVMLQAHPNAQRS